METLNEEKFIHSLLTQLFKPTLNKYNAYPLNTKQIPLLLPTELQGFKLFE